MFQGECCADLLTGLINHKPPEHLQEGFFNMFNNIEEDLMRFSDEERWKNLKENSVFCLRIFENNTVDLTSLLFTRTGLRNHEWPQTHQNIWSSVLLQFLQFWYQEVWWIFLYFNFIARSCVFFPIWNINERLFVLLHSAAWTHHHVVNSFLVQFVSQP